MNFVSDFFFDKILTLQACGCCVGLQCHSELCFSDFDLNVR